MKTVKYVARFAVGVLLSVLTTTASAGDDLLNVLRESGTLSEEEYNSLKKESRKDIQAKFEEGIVFKSYDGDFEIKLGGRVMADAAFYDEDKTTLGNGTEIRRVRFGVEGTMYSDWEFEIEFDFAGNETDVKDVFLRYAGFRNASITAGNFKEPFSLEEMTSSKYITFMERSLANVFTPGRHIGLGLNGFGEGWTMVVGIFGEEVGSGDEGEDEGYSVSGRVTIAPWHEKNRALHLGLSAFYQTPEAGSDESVRFRERPESHVTSERFINTDDIPNVSHFTVTALETAGVFGPYSLQGEYITTNVNRKNGLSTLNFNGAYIFASWFLTGESRNYKAKSGKFGRVKPGNNAGDGGIGAWELAARYSTVDLNDGEISGGREDNITLGLNWYANPNVRFMTNYIFVDTDANAGDESPRIFQMRVQVDF